MRTDPFPQYDQVFVILRVDTASARERSPEAALALVKALREPPCAAPFPARGRGARPGAVAAAHIDNGRMLAPAIAGAQ